MIERAGVVQAQAFDVDDFQPGLTDLRRDHRQVRQLAVGEHIFSNEFTGTAPHRTAIGVLGGDPVIHHQAALFHRAEQSLAVLREIGVAHVFKHADADYLVEAAILRQIAIVEQLQLDQVLQALRFYALPGQSQLLLAEGDTEHSRAKLSRSKTRQSAPTTPNIQQIFAGLQAQLATQMTELGLLGLLEAFAAGLEVSAGIRHVAVEPQLIERVGKVVVVGNRLGVHLFVVGVTNRLIVVAFIQQRLAPFIADADHIADGAFKLKFAFDKCSTKGVQTWMGKLGDHLWVLDHNRDTGRRPQIEFMAVPESQAKR
ncbi:hypothetical protein D9M72_484040 [compost metagenome]